MPDCSSPSTGAEEGIDNSLTNNLAVSNLDLEDLEAIDASWDFPGINFADLLMPQINDDAAQSSSVNASLTPLTAPTQGMGADEEQQASTLFHLAMPSQPTCVPQLLIQRQFEGLGRQKTANLILHTLKSYPLMMMHHSSLPPFIHQRLVSPEAGNDGMEALNNCISLLHLLGNRVPGSRKLFWRNVRMECERLHEQVHQTLTAACSGVVIR